MTQDTWPFQGRLEHGRWGHGTAPHSDQSNPAPQTQTQADTASRPLGRHGAASLHDAVDRSGPGDHRRVSRAFYGAPPSASQLLAILKSILRPRVLAFAGPVALASAALAWMGKSPAHYDPRYTSSRVEGHPDASAVLDFANRRAAISIADPDGGPPATIGLEMHDVISNGRLVGRLVDEYGTVIATHAADGPIRLTKVGEQALLAAQKEQREAGRSPSARSPEENGPDPRLGFAIETRSEEEANLVASMRAQG